MSIPANIVSELQFLEAQVAANKPLVNATPATKEAMKLNAAQLVSDIQTALTASPSILDTWIAATDPAAIVIGFDVMVTTAQDQSTLSQLRGVVGRAASNLDQI